MCKWPAYRTYQAWLGGKKTSPALWEWMMAMPIGWTASEPLAMARFLSWQRGLGSFLEENETGTLSQ